MQLVRRQCSGVRSPQSRHSTPGQLEQLVGVGDHFFLALAIQRIQAPLHHGGIIVVRLQAGSVGIGAGRSMMSARTDPTGNATARPGDNARTPSPGQSPKQEMASTCAIGRSSPRLPLHAFCTVLERPLCMPLHSSAFPVRNSYLVGKLLNLAGFADHGHRKRVRGRSCRRLFSDLSPSAAGRRTDWRSAAFAHPRPWAAACCPVWLAARLPGRRRARRLRSRRRLSPGRIDCGKRKRLLRLGRESVPRPLQQPARKCIQEQRAIVPGFAPGRLLLFTLLRRNRIHEPHSRLES